MIAVGGELTYGMLRTTSRLGGFLSLSLLEPDLLELRLGIARDSRVEHRRDEAAAALAIFARVHGPPAAEPARLAVRQAGAEARRAGDGARSVAVGTLLAFLNFDALGLDRDDRADGTDRAAEERRRETLGGHVAELEARRRRSRRRSARRPQGNGGPRAERCEKGRRESSAPRWPPAPRAVHQPKGVRAQRLATQWLL